MRKLNEAELTLALRYFIFSQNRIKDLITKLERQPTNEELAEDVVEARKLPEAQEFICPLIKDAGTMVPVHLAIQQLSILRWLHVLKNPVDSPSWPQEAMIEFCETAISNREIEKLGEKIFES